MYKYFIQIDGFSIFGTHKHLRLLSTCTQAWRVADVIDGCVSLTLHQNLTFKNNDKLSVSGDVE